MHRGLLVNIRADVRRSKSVLNIARFGSVIMVVYGVTVASVFTRWWVLRLNSAIMPLRLP